MVEVKEKCPECGGNLVLPPNYVEREEGIFIAGTNIEVNNPDRYCPRCKKVFPAVKLE